MKTRIMIKNLRLADAEFAGEAGLGGFEFEELVVVGKCDV